MNWFKESQLIRPIAITFYNSYGELGISFQGSKTYTYPNVPPPLYEKIKYLLKERRYPTVYRILQNLKQVV
jgi:hypothetical protein